MKLSISDMFVVLFLIIIFVGLYISISSIENQSNIVQDECRNQCELRGYMFHEYSEKTYSNEICNCADQAGLIYSIYEN